MTLYRWQVITRTNDDLDKAAYMSAIFSVVTCEESTHTHYTQTPKTIGSILIKLDPTRCLIDADPMVFAIWNINGVK